MVVSMLVLALAAGSQAEPAPAGDAKPEPSEAVPDADEPPSAEAQAGRTRVLALGLESQSVGSEALSLLDGRIATALSELEGFDIVTDDDLNRVVELEAQRAAVGCDSTSCLEEVAGALGADLVLYGRVGKIEETYLLQLNLFSSLRATSVGRRELEGESLKAIVDGIGALARELVEQSASKLAPVEGADPGASDLSADAAAGTSAADSPADASQTELESDAEEGGGLLGPVLLWSGVGAAALGLVSTAAFGLLWAGSAAVFFFGDQPKENRTGLRVGAYIGTLGTVVMPLFILVGAGVAASSWLVE